MSFLHYISSFEGTSYEICKIEPPDLYFLLFLLAFITPADTIFHKYLELHSTLSEKKTFVTNLPF